ncbi:MAG TPA: extensin family protein [Polyangiaceae bacterium]|nr:extensin family protein [Polyangiaceae bacterium]
MTWSWPRSLLGALLAATLGGCAREALPPEVPGMVELPVATETGAQASALPMRHGAKKGKLGLVIPDGDRCLSWLEQEGVRFHPLPPKPGMVTPVAVTGSIGGVSYESGDRGALVCDCRLVVALGWLGPELRSLGVREVRHAGAYAYRTTKRGRPSLHAQGLAIDVWGLSTRAAHYDVKRDFVRGAECGDASTPLNQLACDVRRMGLLEEVITPDDDSDHRDHVHLAIAPL